MNSQRHQAALPAGKKTAGLRSDLCSIVGWDPGKLGFVPDAFEVNAETKTVTLWEVCVTHMPTEQTKAKIVRLANCLEGLNWTVRMFMGASDGRFCEVDPRTLKPTMEQLRLEMNALSRIKL
jgi:hypothetical protein